ncbi:MAG: YggS family pyridoxal phosphate-dependent enzyme [Acidobacteriota bacterium]
MRSNLESVMDRIHAAAGRAGRDASEITLIGVTKTVPAARVRAAIEAGLAHIGENRVQEAAAKLEALEAAGVRPVCHLVGHLQSNKARRAVDLFSWIHSVDRADLARRLDRIAGERGVRLNVLLQVDLGQEATKHGIEPARLGELAAVAVPLAHLEVCGLMTIPPLGERAEQARPFFRRLRELRDTLAERGYAFAHLSMGMTNDFEVAIEEGATMVRVGRAIFGERDRIG